MFQKRQILKHEFWNIIIQKYHAPLGNICVIYFLWIQRKTIFFFFLKYTVFFSTDDSFWFLYFFCMCWALCNQIDENI